MTTKIFGLLLILICSVAMTGCLDSGRSGLPVVTDLTPNTDDDTTTEPEPVVPTRPSGGIAVENYCVCQANKPVVFNNCASYCAGVATSEDVRLFLTMKPDDTVLLDPALGSFHNWCTAPIGETNVAPSCKLQVLDENYSVFATLDVSISAGSNLVQADLTSIPFSKSLILSVVEVQSGATTQSKTIKLENTEDDTSTTRALKIDPISMYSCVARSGSITDGVSTFENAIRMNFFFPASDRPQAMPPYETFTLCHDPNAQGQGTKDSMEYPRLFERSYHFSLWAKSDGFFADDSPQDGNPDINNIIKTRLNSTSTEQIQIFGAFRWPTGPSVTAPSSSDDSSGSSAPSTDSNMDTSSGQAPLQGFYMQPWVDENEVPFCPTRIDYETSTNPVFPILKDYIGDTEAVYMAQREAAEMTVNGNVIAAPDDIIIIREGVLSKIWFYIDYTTKQKIPGTASSAKQKTMMFYWPPKPNYDTPLVKNEGVQYLYTVRYPEDIGSSSDITGDLPTKRPSDKRFGCIPKSSN